MAVLKIAAHRNSILAVLHTFKLPLRHSGTPEHGYGKVGENFPTDFGILGRALNFHEFWLTIIPKLHRSLLHGCGILEKFVPQSELVVRAAPLVAVGPAAEVESPIFSLFIDLVVAVTTQQMFGNLS